MDPILKEACDKIDACTKHFKDKYADAIAEPVKETLKEQQEQMNQEIKRLTDKVCELQEKSVDTTPVVDPKELFRIHYKNAISAFNTLLEFIERQEDSNFYFEKTEAMVSLLNEKLKMLNVEETKCQ